MLTKRLSALFAVLFVPTLLLSASPAHAISDDANPWLAIESALCVAHRTVDYAALIGVPVRLETAAWTGAMNGLPTHCHLAGTLGQREAFDIKVPMIWNGQVFPGGCAATEASESDSVQALRDGAISAFGPVSKHTATLMRAVSAQQRDVAFAGVPCD